MRSARAFVAWSVCWIAFAIVHAVMMAAHAAVGDFGWVFADALGSIISMAFAQDALATVRHFRAQNRPGNREEP